MSELNNFPVFPLYPIPILLFLALQFIFPICLAIPLIFSLAFFPFSSLHVSHLSFISHSYHVLSFTTHILPFLVPLLIFLLFHSDPLPSHISSILAFCSHSFTILPLLSLHISHSFPYFSFTPHPHPVLIFAFIFYGSHPWNPTVHRSQPSMEPCHT